MPNLINNLYADCSTREDFLETVSRVNLWMCCLLDPKAAMEHMRREGVMRPIKFRAWHVGFKQMGFLDELWNNHWYSTPRGDAPDKGKIIFDNSNAWMGAHARSGKDIVIMQFTGLLDKNGKEIFEGDIYEIDGGIYEIIWMYTWAGFFREVISPSSYEPNGSEIQPMVCGGIVIGSIYENPELLK